MGQALKFPTVHCTLIGKNNAGKSNIFNALNIVLGAKNPAYIKFGGENYFDINSPNEIKVVISDITENDKNILFALPNLTKQQKGALISKICNGESYIIFLLQKNYEHIQLNEYEEQAERTQDTFEIILRGFNVYRKKRRYTKIFNTPVVSSSSKSLQKRTFCL